MGQAAITAHSRQLIRVIMTVTEKDTYPSVFLTEEGHSD